MTSYKTFYLLAFVGLSLSILTACGQNNKTNSSSSTQNAPTKSEITTAQSSIAETITNDYKRKDFLGDAMLNYIISQKQGLSSVMSKQLEIYSYEDEEATDSRTIIVNYIYRNQVKVPTKEQIAGFEKTYQSDIQFILNDMEKAGITNPRVASVYKNKDGAYLYTLRAGAW